MNRKVIVELRDDGNLYDASGLMMYLPAPNTIYFESEANKTVELVKLGVSVDEIIKLKNLDLI